jgi:hypothetical protein
VGLACVWRCGNVPLLDAKPNVPVQMLSDVPLIAWLWGSCAALPAEPPLDLFMEQSASSTTMPGTLFQFPSLAQLAACHHQVDAGQLACDASVGDVEATAPCTYTIHTGHLIALHQQRGLQYRASRCAPLAQRLRKAARLLRKRLRHHHSCRADGSLQPGGALDNVESTADRRGPTPIWSSFI